MGCLAEPSSCWQSDEREVTKPPTSACRVEHALIFLSKLVASFDFFEKGKRAGLNKGSFSLRGGRRAGLRKGANSLCGGKVAEENNGAFSLYKGKRAGLLEGAISECGRNGAGLHGARLTCAQ